MTISIYLEPEETAALMSALKERQDEVKGLAKSISDALAKKLREAQGGTEAQ